MEEDVNSSLKRSDLAAAGVCVLFGVLISILPYALWWSRTGVPVWLADYDEVFYLQVAAQAYFHHPTFLSDPMVPDAASGNAYSAVTTVPGIVAARWLGLGPLGISFFWRLGSGVGCGLMTYLLLRHCLGPGLKRPIVAMALTCLLLSDVGLMSGHLLVRPWLLAAKVASGQTGTLLATNPRMHAEWRILNPGPSLPFLLLHVWLVLRASERPTRLRLGLAGMGFGLLFYVYFYYYTATCLALILALALDAGHRRVFFHTLWAGGLIGLPGVVKSYLFKQTTSPDWLNRTDKFLPIAHFSQLMIPSVACGLLAVALVWLALRRRDLTYLGLLAIAGLTLANNQVVTGLQIENFHWVFVWAPMISYLTVILLVETLCLQGWIPASRWLLGVLAGLWAVQLGLGVWLRAVEVTQSQENVALMADLASYQADHRKNGAPLVPNAVIAGDPRFVHFATILEDQRPLTGYAARLSPYVDNVSWNERIALNAVLLGQETREFEADQRAILKDDDWGPWARDPVKRDELLEGRLTVFRAVETDCRPSLSRYTVRYIALPAGHELPAALRPEWTRIRAGSSWDVFTSNMAENDR